MDHSNRRKRPPAAQVIEKVHTCVLRMCRSALKKELVGQLESRAFLVHVFGDCHTEGTDDLTGVHDFFPCVT